ncbi:glycosyl transferase family 90 [Seonamhaeicola marinus]|uniref:Lipopolysaccharide biosynthesis protein n=1 Tax=Seonamhaeicola marinus TaxID=1912246 RepID=A0A5D0HV21_9FLAO|nr:glycosyl transferase family 90 [Seonamhaeicola marinus]TYA74761.1 lipopolysaccharide biosynthesis protein [Seonamhaeicola marinus]
MALFKPKRNLKQFYYLKNFIKLAIPDSYFQNRLQKELNALSNFDFEYVKKRVNHYNKLDDLIELPKTVLPLSELKLQKKQRTYFFDSKTFCRYFNDDLKMEFLFGDITQIPNVPSIVKSRPISDTNQNSVLFKLNKIRHFNFISDSRTFESKKDMLIGMTTVKKRLPHREKFFELYFNHPLCELGDINRNKEFPQWAKPKISLDEHLKYKFVLSIEGEDVASNLKWIMSSNSIAVTPKLKFETWYMEQTLVPDYHYIEINDDYSNLEEKLNFYIAHPEKCLDIIKNANAYTQQFKNKKREKLIALLVLEKYFVQTGQLSKRDHNLY